jgi:hypothetical protein
MAKRPIRRTRGGDYAVALSPDERGVLRSLPGQLRELLATHDDDPGLRRLFPTAYPEDEELETEYRDLMSADLLASHAAALETLETTADRDRLTEDEVLGWMAALNSLRLVLGTRLDVTEDMEPIVDEGDPRHAAFALYHYLTWLQDEVVTALSPH